MNYYDLNMSIIQSKQPNLFLKLREKTDENMCNKLDDINSVITRNSEKAVTIRYKGVEYRLNSIYNPSEEAKKWADQFRFTNVNNVITMFGLGNGILTNALAELMGQKDILLIYEPCYDIFIHTINNYDISYLLLKKNIMIFVEGINDFEFHNTILNVVNFSNVKSMHQCIYPKYDAIFTESSVKFFKEIKDSIQFAHINVNTAVKFGGKAIDNIFRNLIYLKNCSSLLELKKIIPLNVPAIIVAAGPSVEDNIEALKQIKGKAVIFAVDRILDYLLDNDIIPDFVVTLDATKSTRYFTTRDFVTVPLISYLIANHEILEKHTGRKIFCTCEKLENEIFKRTGKTPPKIIPSGSVAIIAFSVCVELGFQRIVLVGQDLAYSGDVSHAGGEKDNKIDRKHILIEGIDGTPVESRYDWKAFADRYRDFITLYPNIEVIDAKQKGAKIQGAVQMSLAEVMEKYCNHTCDIPTLMEDLEISFNRDDLKIVQEFISHNKAVLEEIIEKAKSALKICDFIIHEGNYSQNYKKLQDSMKKFNKINKFIEEQMIYSIMDQYIIAKTANHLSDILVLTENNDDYRLSTFKKTKEIYKSLIDVSEYTVEIIGEVIESRIILMEEHDA